MCSKVSSISSGWLTCEFVDDEPLHVEYVASNVDDLSCLTNNFTVTMATGLSVRTGVCIFQNTAIAIP